MGTDDVYLKAGEKMGRTVEKLASDLKGVRTGRASTGLIEGVKVDYYGTPTPLKQLANLGTPEAQMLMVKPFDPGSLGAIEKAIQKADLGLTPQSDGKVIRIAIPPLSAERRKQLAGVVKQMGEQMRISLRNIRRDAIKEIESLKKAGDCSEDDETRAKKSIEDLFKEQETKALDLVEKKQAEVVTV